MPATVPAPQKKRPANLSLAPDRLRFAQAYATAHKTSVSQIVEDLLGALEQTAQAPTDDAYLEDPLDGMLSGWPVMDKSDLRKLQHETRLSR